jgi:hypothetical protein
VKDLSHRQIDERWVDEAPMFSLHSRSESARIVSVVALLLSVCALLALPAPAAAAPEGGEEPPALELAFEPASFDFGQVRLNDPR